MVSAAVSAGRISVPVIVCMVWLEGEDRKALEGEVSRVLCLAGLRGRKTTVEYTVSTVILV